MDVAAFSDDNFDVKEWINKTFKSAEAQDDKDAFVSSLVSKLQLYVQQVNGSLEETSQSVLSNLPRIVRDTQLLQQEAIALKDKMSIVKEEIVRVEKDTALSMSTLEKIDKMKTDLQTAKQSLHEADNWTVLANDVEEVFESGDIESIAIKLSSMQKSLTMLITATDYEEKKLQLEGLKNRLEAITSPQVVQCFTQNNYEKSKYYVEIFRNIDRLPQLLKYYHNCVKVSLLQEWRKIIEQSTDNTNTISYSLHLFYDKLLSEWQNQLKYFNQIFSLTKIDNLIDIYSDLIRNLDPSLTDSITLSLKQQTNAMQLTLLMELKQITRNFANNLNSSIEVTLKSNELTDQNKLLSLAQAIYSPYITFISKYSIYEIALLNQQLNSIDCNHDDLSDTINSLSLSVSKIIDYSLEANKRCKLFTNSCNYHGLLKALNNFFKQYLDKYRLCLKQIERRMSKHEDWNLFQMCLTLMQTVGDLSVQIEQLEKTLVINIVEANNKLSLSTISVFEQYKILLLTQAGRNELNELILSLQDNDKTILDSVKKLINKFSGDLHRTTYDVIFAPIYTQLMFIQKAPAWSKNINSNMNNDNHLMNLNMDLPDYSFAPQEYITQVGQYLMTLPQHLEPFLLRDNPSLIHALRAADTQYTTGSSESGFTDILLGIIAKGTCQMFQDQALGICELNPSACKQLATDIDYLGNILEELGLSLSVNLQQMSLLLRLSVDDYLTGSAGCNPRIVAAIRQMRNIASSG